MIPQPVPLVPVLARPTCRRCGEPLHVSLVGIPQCLTCHRREHGEIDQLVAGLRVEAERAHQRLTAHAIALELKQTGGPR